MLSGSDNEGLVLTVCVLWVLVFIGWSTITLESFESWGNINFKHQRRNYFWVRETEERGRQLRQCEINIHGQPGEC